MNVGHDMLQYFLKKEDTLSKRLVIHFSKKKKKKKLYFKLYFKYSPMIYTVSIYPVKCISFSF